jgi:DNA polymerase-3 subunit alpha
MILDMEEWEEPMLLAHEKEALGFYLSGHPLAQYGKRLKGLVTHTVSGLAEAGVTDAEVSLAGIMTTIRLLKTRKDERMATFVLEDMSGRVEVVAFPECYKNCYDSIRDGLLVWIKGRLQGGGDRNKVQALQVVPLERAFEMRARKLILRVHLPGIEPSVFQDLKGLLGENPGECPVYFELQTETAGRVVVQSVEVPGVTPSERLTRSLEELLGENTVQIQF